MHVFCWYLSHLKLMVVEKIQCFVELFDTLPVRLVVNNILYAVQIELHFNTDVKEASWRCDYYVRIAMYSPKLIVHAVSSQYYCSLQTCISSYLLNELECLNSQFASR